MKNKTPRYMIVTADDSEQLVIQVNGLLARGWEPLGGVSVIWDLNEFPVTWRFFQAVLAPPVDK